MTQVQPLQQQIEQLQQQHEQLQQACAALESACARQQTEAQTWVTTRAQELAAERQRQMRSQALQTVFYRITERATADLSLFDFAQLAHSLLCQLIDAKNCYLALYQPHQHTLDFPYYVDERDGDTMQCNDVPYRRGLTEYVLRTAQPQLIDQQRYQALQQAGDITEATGDLSFSSWLGVPLQIQGAISGVLAVQRYEGAGRYSQDDVDILSFFGSHFSTAIERYQTTHELRKSEARYRTLIEKVGLGVVVLQAGRIVFVNPSIEQTTGYTKAYLIAHAFTDVVHPDDQASVLQRYALRQDQPFGHGFQTRIVTAQGAVRSLEFSAVPIQWNKQPANLLFALDITERLLAEAAQRSALQEQTELNAMKSRFIAMASHEFRTPLATIHGSVELLRHYDSRLRTTQKQQTLVKIADAVQRMSGMLESVMQMGHENAGQMVFKPAAVALLPLLQNICNELQLAVAAFSPPVSLVADATLTQQELWLDATLLRTILSNLLSNAFKYSAYQTAITVHLSLDADHLLLSVSDQGIGIPAADLPQLFGHFHRASNVGLLPGTGLGLSIVKAAVQLHGGQITVASQVGAGSCFTVHLPTQVCA